MGESKKQVPTRHTEHDERHNTQTQRLDDATSFPLARTSPCFHSVHFKRVSPGVG